MEEQRWCHWQWNWCNGVLQQNQQFLLLSLQPSPTVSPAADPLFVASLQKWFCLLNKIGVIGFLNIIIFIYLRFNITVESLKWIRENPSNGYHWQMHVLGAHIQLLTGAKQLSGPRRTLEKRVPLVSRALGHLSQLSLSCLTILRKDRRRCSSICLG